MARKKSDFTPRVERREVESSSVISLDFDDSAALHEWMLHLDAERERLAGAIVAVRARVDARFAFSPAQVRAALLMAGAREARISFEPVPEPRRERVEGISALPNPRHRLARFLESRYPPEWDDDGGKLHPVAVEALRVYEQEEGDVDAVAVVPVLENVGAS